MLFYFLPEPTIHGGIKVGFQFAALLRQLGIDTVMVTPNGSAPTWFASQVPVLRREKVFPKLTRNDQVMFSLPHDYKILKNTKASLIFHCQGTDEAIVPIVLDESVELLTCWNQASEFTGGFGRQSVNVGISISREFFYSGQLKQLGSYAVMPRRGSLFFPEKLASFTQIPITGLNEQDVSEILKRASAFLALSEDEWFGLPALEAMAAGCLVISPKTIGGIEYLNDGKNCFIESVEHLSERLSLLLNNEITYRDLRHEAMKTAAQYHPRAQFHHLEKIFESGDLKFLK
jgi:glycosyltransferase involved in cell wall biosynthesis